VTGGDVEERAVFKNKLLPYLLIAPQIILTGLWFIYPAVVASYQSLFRSDPLGIRTTFVGVQNYTRLFSDPRFFSSLRVTLVFAVSVTVLSMFIGLFLASMADKPLRGRKVYRTLLLLPYALAPAVTAVLWRFLLAPRIGIIARFLGDIGIRWDYRLDGVQALFLVILVAVWQRIAYNFIFYLAALQSMPRSVIEAARLDGAGSKRTFWSVVFPILSPTTFFLLIMNIVYSLFEGFGIIHALTQGGPAGATEILVYRLYVDGMIYQNINRSAAQSVVLLVFVVLLTALQFRWVDRRVHYG